MEEVIEEMSAHTTTAPHSFVNGFFAGTVAGMASKIIGHPFDTIPSQLFIYDLLIYSEVYHNTFDCLYKMVTKEGVRSLYQGLASPLVGAALEIAVIFAANEQMKALLRRYSPNPVDNTGQPTPLTLTQITLAGGLAGTCVSFVLTPLELIKCRLQVQQNNNTQSMRYQGPVDVVVKALKENPTSLYKGHLGTMLRETIGNMAWFGVYPFYGLGILGCVLLTFHIYEASCRFLTPPGQSRENLGAWQKVTAGGLAGVVFWAIPFPADVVKSCMQTMSSTDPGKNLGFLAVLRHIVKTQGFFALYRGFSVTALRADILPSAPFFPATSALTHHTSM